MELDLAFDDATSEFLEDLTEQYQPSRYGDVMLDYSREDAERYFGKAVEICEQLLGELS